MKATAKNLKQGNEKPKIHIKGAIKEGVVIHCETEEEAKRILGMAHELGYAWSNGESYIDSTNWWVRESTTCYYLFGGSYTNYRYFKNGGFTIIPSTQIADLKDIEEIKIKALLEGLEAENIEEFMRKAKVSDYRNYGKAYVLAVKSKIKE